MLKEALGEEEHMDCCMQPKDMFPLAIATSIDALAVGVTFAFLKISIIPAVSFIGVVTFVCSAIGVKIEKESKNEETQIIVFSHLLCYI